MSVLDDAVPFRKLDDQSLIQGFVESRSALLSNQQLRIESTFDARQLLARKEGVVATIKQVNNQEVVLVRHKSDFWQMIHEALVAAHFIPLSYPDKKGFIEYQKHEIPAGYTLSYDEARLLWKDWWIRKRKYNSQTIQMELLLMVRKRWFPVRDIISNEGTLYITTLVGDITLSGSDCVAWLTRTDKQSPGSHLGRRLATPGANPSTNAIPNQPAAPTGAHPYAHHIPRKLPPTNSLPSSTPAPTPAQSVAPTQRQQPPTQLGTAETTTTHANLKTVIRSEQGRLFIRTAIGEVVVEGANLKCWLHQANPTP